MVRQSAYMDEELSKSDLQILQNIYFLLLSGRKIRSKLVLTKELKLKIIRDNQLSAADSGSPEVQVALMTERINELINHFQIHKKDFHSRRGLMKLVGQRKRLLEYLKETDKERYQKLITKLNLRK